MLIHGDCLEEMDRLIKEGVKVDAVITDPPYQYLDHKLDVPFNEERFFKLCYQVLKPDSFLVFFGRGISFARWILICDKLGFKFKEEIVWDKKQISSPFHILKRKHELAVVFVKGNKKMNLILVDKNESNGEDYQSITDALKRITSAIKKIQTPDQFFEWKKGKYVGVTKIKYNLTGTPPKSTSSSFKAFKRQIEGGSLSSIIRVFMENRTSIHPAQKPVRLLQYLCQLVSKEKDLILDPFSGSGTTGEACNSLKRNYIGIEINEEYYNFSKKRLDNLPNHIK